MTRPPHAASSVVGYASDTASAVAKVEPNSNRSRETGRPYCQPGSARPLYRGAFLDLGDNTALAR